MTENEQVEQLKKWWHEYGTAALIGMFIAVVGGFGWHAWQQKQENILSHASMRYEQLLTNIVNNNAPAAEAGANRLIKVYSHTPYAQLAALQLARQAVYAGKLGQAEEKLFWLSKHGKSDALRSVANIRLARVLLADKKPQVALEVLTKNTNAAYLAAVEEIKGDIYVSLGKITEARKAYKNALKAFPALEVMQPLLQMKLDDLAVDTPETSK